MRRFSFEVSCPLLQSDSISGNHSLGNHNPRPLGRNPLSDNNAENAAGTSSAPSVKEAATQALTKGLIKKVETQHGIRYEITDAGWESVREALNSLRDRSSTVGQNCDRC
jgi:hypothetical protein